MGNVRLIIQREGKRFLLDEARPVVGLTDRDLEHYAIACDDCPISIPLGLVQGGDQR